ncbi:MAG: hypothetical protein EOP11_24565 [Proteobacteria bacterium]|nr:MAG: hypothetical protein EOP11_24565 [Pseudomonadota bacterium]
MNPEQLMKDLIRRLEAHTLSTIAVKHSLNLLADQAAKPAYHRDPLLIEEHWAKVKAYGLRTGLFAAYEGDVESRRHLAMFLDSCRPKKGNRERKWTMRDSAKDPGQL